MISLFKKNSIVSTILNVLGMTAAFAAMYVIFVQVHHDFTYNHGIKDSDRIYVMTLPDFYEEGKYSVFLNRPAADKCLAQVIPSLWKKARTRLPPFSILCPSEPSRPSAMSLCKAHSMT